MKLEIEKNYMNTNGCKIWEEDMVFANLDKKI